MLRWSLTALQPHSSVRDTETAVVYDKLNGEIKGRVPNSFITGIHKKKKNTEKSNLACRPATT